MCFTTSVPAMTLPLRSFFPLLLLFSSVLPVKLCLLCGVRVGPPPTPTTHHPPLTTRHTPPTHNPPTTPHHPPHNPNNPHHTPRTLHHTQRTTHHDHAPRTTHHPPHSHKTLTQNTRAGQTRKFSRKHFDDAKHKDAPPLKTTLSRKTRRVTDAKFRVTDVKS